MTSRITADTPGVFALTVWWETQQDPTLVFGIPQVGFQDEQGHFLERTQIEPDVKVSNNPEMVSEGEDQQLEKAVELLMQN